MKNTQAYNRSELINAIKMFMLLALGFNVLKLFLSVMSLMLWRIELERLFLTSFTLASLKFACGKRANRSPYTSIANIRLGC